MGKKWYFSKTFWVNALALVALVVQSVSGFVISPEEQAALLVTVNLFLRAITKEPIEG